MVVGFHIPTLPNSKMSGSGPGCGKSHLCRITVGMAYHTCPGCWYWRIYFWVYIYIYTYTCMCVWVCTHSPCMCPITWDDPSIHWEDCSRPEGGLGVFSGVGKQDEGHLLGNGLLTTRHDSWYSLSILGRVRALRTDCHGDDPRDTHLWLPLSSATWNSALSSSGRQWTPALHREFHA